MFFRKPTIIPVAFFVWIQGNHSGSYYIANNTIFNVIGPLFLNYWKSPFDLVDNIVVEHNTVYMTTRQVFEIMYAIKSYTIKNNLFVDGYCRGVALPGSYKGVEYGGDGVVPFDNTRPGNETEGFFPIDTLAVEWGVAENERDIQNSSQCAL